MEMTADRWAYLGAYSREVFGRCDAALEALTARAKAQGLPDISIGPDVGRLLMMQTQMVAARTAVEVGTLGGYSAIWIARGLAAGGRLITIEPEPAHAAFARAQFEAAGVADRVELIEGTGLDVLPRLRGELGPDSVDVVFLDAIKREYPDYWAIVRPMIRPGGLILADNVYGSSWAIDDEADPQRQAVDRFNRAVASDPDFDAVAVPLREGVLIGRRKGPIPFC